MTEIASGSIFTFIFWAFLAFFIPGHLALYPLRRPFFEIVVIGPIIGIVLWAIQGYVFGLMGLRWMTYPYLAVLFITWVLVNRKVKITLGGLAFSKVDFLGLSIIITGTILHLSAVWFMGVFRDDGLYFCCRGVTDAIYHLSLTGEIIKNTPPFEPGMAGVMVKNYHYLSNLVAAEISRVSGLGFIKVQFQFLNLILALILGSCAFILGNLLGLGRAFSRWLAVFFYGSGDVLYLLLFIRGRGLNFDVTVLDDATKLLVGPPRAFSIVILLGALCLFLIWIKRKDLYSGFLVALLLGSLIGFKVYTGIFALSGLAAIGAYYLFKKDYKMILPPLFSAAMSGTYFFQVNKDAGGLHANGFWRFENFMQHKDLAISKLDYLRLAQLQEGRIFEVVMLEILFIAIYFFFLFGTVNIAFLQNRKSLKLFPKELHLFLIPALVVSLVVGSFFYQETGGANTVQFLITAFIMSSIYVALSLYFWLKNSPRILGQALIILILLLTLPRGLYEVFNNFSYLAKNQGQKIESRELAALSYLRAETDDNAVFLVEPWMTEDQPFMYVTFLANRPSYLVGAGVLRDHGQDTRRREDVVKRIFTQNDPKIVKELLRENQIEYIYLPEGTQFAALRGNPSFLQIVFDNTKYRILKFAD